MKRIKHREDRIRITARTLTELARMDGMTVRNAQKRKDLYAEVVIPYGKPDENGNRRVHKRYLDKETTALLS